MKYNNRSRHRFATYILLIAVLASTGQYVMQGSVTWPDSAARTVDRYFSSVYLKAASLLNRADIQYASDSPNTASKPDASQPIPPAEFGLTGQVVRVVDGDTVELRAGETVRIRLHGIDTPEKGQPFGKAATRELSRLIAGKTIGVEVEGKDRYGRTVGVIYLDGKNINLMMVESGYAWWYRQYARGDLNLMQAEASAKEAKKGLWADPDPMPPWEWRRK